MEDGRAPPTAALRADRIVQIAAFLLLSASALMGPLLVTLSATGPTGCEDRCDAAVVTVGSALIVYGLLGTAVVALTGLLLLHRPDRLLWWLPCVGLLVAAVIVLVGDRLIDLGPLADS